MLNFLSFFLTTSPIFSPKALNFELLALNSSWVGVPPRGRPPRRLGRWLPKSLLRLLPKLLQGLVPERLRRRVPRQPQERAGERVRELPRGLAPRLPPKLPRELPPGLTYNVKVKKKVIKFLPQNLALTNLKSRTGMILFSLVFSARKLKASRSKC